ncbi:unnamed protein product, partial [Rotaria sp. Silwood2]
ETDLQFDMLKEMLSTMHRLKYLTLILTKSLTTDNNILSGIQWKSFLRTLLIFLKRFNFKFSIQTTSEQDIYYLLNTFKSKWWITEKRCFVEYDTHENTLIILPYFASKTLDNRHLYSFDLIQNSKIFYSNINYLSIDLHKYNKIEQILVSQPGYLTRDVCDAIRNNVDLNMIQHFEFSSTVSTTEAFIELIENMTNLSSIHIQYFHSLVLFNQVSSPIFSIRHLVLFDYEPTARKRLFYRLCRIFPRLTHLTTHYHSRRRLCYLLNELVHLEQLILRLAQDQYAPNYSWIKQHSRLRMNPFKMRVFNIAYRERKRVLLINTNNNMKHQRHRQPYTLNKCRIQ